MLAAEALGMRSVVSLAGWRLGFAAMAFGSFLVFTARDILFLQWCLLTRMKRPMMKGFLFLVLYYTAVSLLGLVISVIAAPARTEVLTLLAPYTLIGALDKPDIPSAFIFAGIALQVAVCVLILLAIQRRLDRPVYAPLASAA